jgi:hypothetical protein
LESHEKAIWKYELKMESEQTLEVPNKHRICSVGTVKNHGFIWIEVHGDAKDTVEIGIRTVITGEKYPDNYNFLGTLFYNDGEIVQHVFSF